MGFLVGFLFLTATWLTFLTRKNREQARKNKVLELRNRERELVIAKLKQKINGKRQKGQAGETDQTSDTGTTSDSGEP